MGLDTTHDAWHGAYSAFMRWRQEIAKVAGLPPLMLMEGFYKSNDPIFDPMWSMDKGSRSENPDPTLAALKQQLPIRWDCLKPSPLHILLYHSDCEGDIPWEDCQPIASALSELLPKIEGEGGGHIGNYKQKTQQFIDGLLRAAAAKEDLIFQ